jgi:excisionase family DNA binding protein
MVSEGGKPVAPNNTTADPYGGLPMRRDQEAGDKAAAKAGGLGRPGLVSDGLRSIAEACEYLSVSRSTLYLLMDGGELAYCKIRGARRIPYRALVALAAKCLVGVVN